LENIFTGEKGTITSLPNLFIDSHDVQVSHSSKSHRLDRSQLFYLQSRRLDEKESIHLMTKSYFQHTFSCLEMLDRKIFESMYEEFHKF
jgi:Fe-S cluster assembly scaffold protein SufB